METITAYKGFEADWTCRGFAYEVGKSYAHDGDVALCQKGFHACENPLDTLCYYPPTGRMAEVSLGDFSEETDNDSKRVGKSITIKAEITIPLLVSAAITYIEQRCCGPVKAKHSTGYSSASSATGYSSASSATGDRSASSTTGHSSASSTTGHSSASSTTGHSSASSTTGYRSASSTTGHRSASSTTGDRSASSATGHSSASLTTNWDSSSEITPDPDGKPLHAIAVAAGGLSKARAPAGSAIVIVHRDQDSAIQHIFASKVGENGIEPDVFYTLNAEGKPVAV